MRKEEVLISTAHEILFGWQNGEWSLQGMRQETFVQDLLGNLNESDHLKDPGVDEDNIKMGGCGAD